MGEELRVKVELYYQDLYDIPVSSDQNSTGSGINYTFGFTTVEVVSGGTAQNLGAEFTLEKFFSKNYYYLFTASLFDSYYTSTSGKKFRTDYANNYLFNLLGGKEFKVGKKKRNLI